MANAKIMIVENTTSVDQEIEKRLKTLGYTVCATVPCGAQAIEKISEMRPDLVLVNIGLEGGMEAVEVAEKIYYDFNIPVIYLIDSIEEDVLERIKGARIFGHIFQPFDTNQLDLGLEHRLHWHEVNRENTESDERFSTILNSVSDAVIATDQEGLIIFMNPAAERMTGWQLVEAARMDIKQIFRTDAEEDCPVTAALRSILDTGTAPSPEAPTASGVNHNALLTTKSGQKTHIDYNTVPSNNAKGQFIGIVITFRDITDYKVIEERLNQTIGELRNKTQLMETVFNSVYDGIVVLDSMGQVSFVNSSLGPIYGTVSSDIDPSAWSETYGLFYPDKETYVPIDQMPFIRALRGEETDEEEFFIRNDYLTDGIYVTCKAFPLFDENQQIVGSVGIVRDITKDKTVAMQLEQTMQELQNQVQLTDTIFNSISDGVIATDTEGQYLMVNSKARETIGVSFSTDLPVADRSKHYGLFYPDGKTLFPGDDLPLTRAFRGERTDNIEMFVCNDIQTEGNFINVSGRPLLDNQGHLRGGVVVFHDITELKAAQTELEKVVQDLRDQTQLMEIVFDSMADGVLVTDTNSNLLFSNQKATQVFNLEVMTPDLLPSAWAERGGLFEADKETYLSTDRNPLLQALRGEATDDMEVFVRNRLSPDGIHLNVNGRPLLNADNEVTAGVVIFRDTTKDKEAADQLEQTIGELRNQTQLMETVFNGISDGLVVVNSTGEILLTNPSIRRTFNMEGAEAPPSEWSETYGIFYPDKETYVPMEQLPLFRAIQGEEIYEKEFFIHNENKAFGAYISASATPLRSVDNQEIIGSVGIVHDITQRKAAETELTQALQEQQEQTQLMETVFNSVSDGVVVTNEAGEFLFVNPSAERIVGMGATDTPPNEWSDTYGTFYPDKVTPFPSEELPLVHAIQGKMTDDIDLFIRNQENPDGVFINVAGRPLQGKQDSVRGGVIVFRDVTAIKNTEAELEQTVTELQNQTQLMEAVFNHMSDGVVLADKEGQYIMANRTAEQMTGHSLQQPVEARNAVELYGFFLPDEKTPFPADQLPIVRALRREPVDNIGMFIYNPSTRREGIHLSISARPLYDSQGTVTGSVSVARDITELRQAEINLKHMIEQLEEQGALLESIFNSISDGVVVADANGDFTIFNPSAERIVGMGATPTDPDEWSDTYGLFFPDRVTPFPADELPLARAIKGETSDEVEMFVRNPNVPEGVFISISGRPLQDETGSGKGGVIVFRDVTQRMIAEEALTQAFAQGRLEIVDTILHNIGNAINSVTSGVEVLYRELKDNSLIHRLAALASAIKAREDDWIDYIKNDPQGQQVLPFICAIANDFNNQNNRWLERTERIKLRATHIADIIITQRSFGNSSIVRKDVSIYKMIDDALKLQQESINKKGIQIDIDCEKAPQEIRIQESQFHQMLVNLIKNSIEAIDERVQSGGLNETPHIHIRTYINGDFYCLEVIDNGIGIKPENSKTIFAAGYTTKQSGSGLGLHSIANFVIASGGQIQPLSEGIGKGMTMRVMLRLSSILP